MKSAVLTLAFAAVALLSAAPRAETLLVVRKTDDAVDFMDPGSGLRLASVALGHAPHEVSVAPDGRRAAITNYGTRERAGSTLSIVDLEQPRELARIDLAPHTRPHGVAWFAADRIAVTTEGSQHLLIVDPAGGRVVSAIATGQDVSHMVAVSTDARRAYVTNIGPGTVTALDLEVGSKLGDVVTGAGSEMTLGSRASATVLNTPPLISGWPKRALDAANALSQDAASMQPAPSAGPATTPSNGLSSLARFPTTRWNSSSIT